MRDFFRAVVAGIIVMVTQSGSVMVVGDLSALDNASRSFGLTLPVDETFTRDAVATRGPHPGVIQWDYPGRHVIGPRRGPVK
jgi:hypothetical protein